MLAFQVDIYTSDIINISGYLAILGNQQENSVQRFVTTPNSYLT